MKNLNSPLVSIYSLNMAYKFYLKKNLDLDELFNTCGCSYEEIQDENKHITIDILIKSLDLVKMHLKQDVSLSSEFGDHLKLSDFGTFGFTLLAAPSLEEGLELIINGFIVMNPNFDFHLKKFDSKSVVFSIESLGHFKNHDEEILDLACLMFLKYIEYFTININLTSSVFLDNKKPQKTKRNIIINKALLKLPSSMVSPAFFQSNRKQIIKRSKEYKKFNGCIFVISKIIRNHVKKGYKPCFNDISIQLGTTNKTLSRLLKSHNTSFQKCLDQVICDEAINLIKAEYNTKEIAYALGFQSIAGLNYLFIKKYGLTLNQLKGSLGFS